MEGEAEAEAEASIDGGGEGGGRPRESGRRFSDKDRRRIGSGNCSMMSPSYSDEREGDGVRGNGVEGLSNKKSVACVGNCGSHISAGGCRCKTCKSSGVSLKFRLCWQWDGGGAGGGNEGFRVSGTIRENGQEEGVGCYLGRVALHLYDGMGLTSWYLGPEIHQHRETGPPISRSHHKTIMANRGHLGRGWTPFAKVVLTRVISR